MSPSGPTPDERPGLSFVLAVFDPPLDALRAQLDAIAAQRCDDWECVVVDDASRDPEVRALLDAWVRVDARRRLLRRPVNGGIAAATNDGLDAARGRAVTIVDHDDVVDVDAAGAILDHLAAHPGDGLVYTDERVIDERGRLVAEYHKPEYGPRRHLGHHYLAHLVAVRREVLDGHRVRAAFEPAQDVDLLLRIVEGAAERGLGVGHLPRILYSWRAISGSSARDAGEKPEMAAAVERSMQAALDRRGIPARAETVVHRGAPTTSVLLVPTEAPTASVELVEVGLATTPSELDAAIRASAADVVCLVPPGADVDEAWAAPLVVEARRDDVGAVGPRLVTAGRPGPDGSAGDGGARLLGVGRTVGPTLAEFAVGEAADEPGPWGAFFVAREVSALAPEGLTVERSAYLDAGGLPVDVGLDVAVAELCAALAAGGRATIWTPAAELAVTLPAGAKSLLEARSPDVDGPDRLAGELARAARRRPELRDERWAAIGTSSFRHHVPHALGEGRAALAGGSIRLVTCDVFDTVVTRPVATPSDLFVELGRRAIEAGRVPAHVTPALFAAARREAERRARDDVAGASRTRLLARLAAGLDLDGPDAAEPDADDPDAAERAVLAHGGGRADGAADPAAIDRADEVDRHPSVAAPECTLEEIWARMPWGLADDVERWIEAELRLEAEHLRPVADVLDLLDVARRAEIPVVLVSDIYLGADRLERLLAAAGVDTSRFAAIVTSADRRLAKAHGLLAAVVAERGVDPAQVVHVGDNEIADVRTARELGALAVHVDVPAAERHAELPHPGLRAWSRRHAGDLGISAAVRAALVADVAVRSDPAAQFGAGVVGPALAGFSRWVADTTTELGATTVHCLLREGATIAELLAVTAPDGPAAVPLHVSRWVTMRAAVVDATPDELLVALARRAELTVGHVVRAFGCDPDRVRAVLGAERVEPGRLPDACVRLAGDDELAEAIRASAADLRERVLAHLRPRLDASGPIVVADVGWGGTIQEGLERILRAGGVDREVTGLYLALSGAGEERLRRGARMRSYLPNELDDPAAARRSRTVAHHADTLEQIMTPDDVGTLLDVATDGEPITAEALADPVPSRRAARAGVAAVARRLVDGRPGGLDDPRWHDPGLRAAFAEAIADVVAAPSPAMAAALGAWPHDDVAGADARPIAGADLAPAARWATARDVSALDPFGRKWVAAVAALANPTLLAQMEADRHGVDVEALAPTAESGVARLTAFAIGSEAPAAQLTRLPFTLPGGWSALHLVGEVASLRALRFDAADRPALVELGEVTLSIGTDEPFDPPARSIDDLRTAGLTWAGARPLGARRYVAAVGGHLVVPIEPDVGERARSVDVLVAFRAWPLDPDDALLTPPLPDRAAAQLTRAARALRRRLPR